MRYRQVVTCNESRAGELDRQQHHYCLKLLKRTQAAGVSNARQRTSAVATCRARAWKFTAVIVGDEAGYVRTALGFDEVVVISMRKYVAAFPRA